MKTSVTDTVNEILSEATPKRVYGPEYDRTIDTRCEFVERLIAESVDLENSRNWVMINELILAMRPVETRTMSGIMTLLKNNPVSMWETFK